MVVGVWVVQKTAVGTRLVVAAHAALAFDSLFIMVLVFREKPSLPVLF